jgi:DNA-binding transcriptional MerR regulator
VVVPSVAIPNRSVFRAQEVCEIAELQAFVLRGWEAEFPDLGVAKGAGGPRLYRRADVELVLKLKSFVFDEGLTLAGARRRLADEGYAPTRATEDDTITDADVAALVDKQTLRSLRDVRQGLGWILDVLDRQGRERPGRASGRSRVESKGRTAKPAAARASATKRSAKAPAARKNATSKRASKGPRKGKTSRARPSRAAARGKRR